jgi:hypothetical protein
VRNGLKSKVDCFEIKKVKWINAQNMSVQKTAPNYSDLQQEYQKAKPGDIE